MTTKFTFAATTRSWNDFLPAIRHAPALAVQNPDVTGYMAFRAREAGDQPQLAQRSDWTLLCDVSGYLVCAVVKAEDPRFFRHKGIAWDSVWNAVVDAVRHGRVRGASTITQQLARNLYLDPVRSVSRKAREAILARRLEQTLTKPRIIELYLNVVEWGKDLWGIAAASRYYFGCAPRELGPFEAIFLASLLPAPLRPLTGPNADRAAAVQFRLARQFLRSALVRPAEAQRLLERIGRVWRKIPTAPSVPAALLAVRQLPPILDPDRLPPSAQEAIATERVWAQTSRDHAIKSAYQNRSFEIAQADES